MNARRRVVRAGLGIAAIGAALLTSACGTGQRAMTAEEVPAIDGQSATVGQMALRDIAVATPDDGSVAIGDNALLTFVVANDGRSEDQLLRVSSTAFSSVTQTSITVQPGSAVPVGIGNAGATVVLTGLTAEGAGDDKGLFPGESVPVTFSFKNAGSVTAQVPVALGQGGTHATVTAPAGSDDSGE